MIIECKKCKFRFNSGVEAEKHVMTEHAWDSLKFINKKGVKTYLVANNYMQGKAKLVKKK